MFSPLLLSLWACQSNEKPSKIQQKWVKFESFALSTRCVGTNAEPSNQFQQRFKVMQKDIQVCFSGPPEPFSYSVSIVEGVPKSLTFADPRIEKSPRGICVQKQSLAWSFHSSCTDTLKIKIVPIKK